MSTLHDRVASVTERIDRRSHDTRSAYLEDIEAMETSPDSDRRDLSCSNLAHAAAAAGPDQNKVLGDSAAQAPNIGIITSYNDMLSAHQPFETYPQIIRAAAQAAGGSMLLMEPSGAITSMVRNSPSLQGISLPSTERIAA